MKEFFLLLNQDFLFSKPIEEKYSMAFILESNSN
jgi:hypothetical protein